MPAETTAGVLAGRVALVTGASSGIGLACVELFAQQGATVHGVARRDLATAPEAAVLKDAIARGSVVGHQLDVADEVGVSRLAEQLDQSTPIDILVCAAGTNIREREIRELSPADWRRVINTNLDGTFNVLHAFLPQLERAPGDVVTISSVAAAWPDHSGPAYQASKAGMLALARGAAYTQHRYGVRFTNVLPGLVNTPLLDRRPQPPTDEARRLAVQPSDVAEACLLAVSLPRRVTMSEVTLVATYLQAHGKTQDAAPSVPSTVAPQDTTSAGSVDEK